MKIQCEFCKKEFARESSIIKHSCNAKRRWQNRQSKESQVALECYSRWYRLAMGARTDKTFEEFSKSKYYNAFISFSRYCLSVNCKSIIQYMDWLIKEQKHVRDWCKDSVYTNFLNEHIKREPAERAAERFVLLAEKWAKDTGNDWTEYWAKAHTNLIYDHLLHGKISPWILLTNDQAQAALDNMPDEMIQKIVDTLDVKFWRRKISVRPEDTKWLEQMFK